MLAPGFAAPPNLDYSSYHQYIEEMLPPESPALYGLHPNAEIEFLTVTSNTLFRVLLEMQPRNALMSEELGQSTEEKVKDLSFVLRYVVYTVKRTNVKCAPSLCYLCMYTHIITIQVKTENVSNTPERYSCPLLVNIPFLSICHSKGNHCPSLIHHSWALPVFEQQIHAVIQSVLIYVWLLSLHITLWDASRLLHGPVVS